MASNTKIEENNIQMFLKTKTELHATYEENYEENRVERGQNKNKFKDKVMSV